MSKQIVQKNNIVTDGDIVAGNKYVKTTVFNDFIIAEQDAPIRTELQLDLENDSDNTTLVFKLKRGGFSNLSIEAAKISKVKTLGLIIPLIKSENGKAIISDIYENLISIIQIKYLSKLNPGEETRTKLSEITFELSALCIKYTDILRIDEAFLTGMLYLATSNCALWWKIDE